MAVRVLCLLAEGVEEIEALTPVDLLRRAGAEVVMASIRKETLLTGRNGIRIQADAVLDNVDFQTFDLLLLPGGPGVAALRADGRAAKLAAEFLREGKPVAAICAAPTILADAGVLEGKRFTAHFSVKEELPKALLEERVVEDGPLLTARGAGVALDFALALVRRLFGEQKEREVAESIMAG